MRNIHFSIIVILCLSLTVTTAYSQNAANDIEAEIRKLEAQQIEYLLAGQLQEMKKNWAADYTVNNPFNVIQDAATGPIQTGVLTYTKFERNIEKVLIHDGVAIVMGGALVLPKTAPKGSSHDTIQEIKRRFTDVWMQIDGKWLLVARHASNICGN